MYNEQYIKIKATDVNGKDVPMIGVVEGNTLVFIGYDIDNIENVKTVGAFTSEGVHKEPVVDLYSILIPHWATDLNGEKLSITVIGSKVFTTKWGKKYDVNLSAVAKPFASCRIRRGVMSIEEDAFAGAYFKEMYWPDTIYTIPKGAFRGCSHLERIYGIERVIKIGDDAFSHCINLRSFNWPANCYYIPEYCFMGCSKMQEFFCDGTVEGIHRRAFEYAGLLKFDASKSLTINFNKSDLPSGCKIVYPFYVDYMFEESDTDPFKIPF